MSADLIEITTIWHFHISPELDRELVKEGSNAHLYWVHRIKIRLFEFTDASEPYVSIDCYGRSCTQSGKEDMRRKDPWLISPRYEWTQAKARELAREFHIMPLIRAFDQEDSRT